MSDNDFIQVNRLAHDLAAEKYDSNHPEIFNPTEQNRIHQAFKAVLTHLSTISGPIKALDFGAGTGNLTRHLLDLGMMVTSADVSTGCLAKIHENMGNDSRLATIVLNGISLEGIADNVFDMVATYSVLHHVPDYLSIVDEFVRVAKSGGLIVVDHEVCPSYWRYDVNYLEYLRELGEKFYTDHLYELGIKPGSEDKGRNTVFHALRKLFSYHDWKNPIMGQFESKNRMTSDGDIHVFVDDHIEWDAIRTRLEPHCEVILEEDYLVCRERIAPPAVWEKWHDKVSDMHLLVARKR